MHNVLNQPNLLRTINGVGSNQPPAFIEEVSCCLANGYEHLDPTKSPIPRILKDMANEDLEIVKKALKSLSGVCFDMKHEAENRLEIARGGGIFVLTNCLDKYSSDVSIQSLGFKTLQTLSIDESLDATLIEYVEKMCERMKKYTDHAELQKNACGALRNLAVNNKDRIKKIGGVERIIDAAESHPEDAKLQFAACYALCNLSAGGPYYAKTVIASGGLIVASKAAQNHVYHPQVLKAAKELQNILMQSMG